MPSLAGVRVLVIEDEGPIALMIEDMLADLGCVVTGSAASVEEALTLVRACNFDFALLDMNLRGVSAEGVADALFRSGKPFAIASGYGREGVAAHLRDRPVIRKPFTQVELEKILRDSLA
jgi:CheY-like chemotaxis protein